MRSRVLERYAATVTDVAREIGFAMVYANSREQVKKRHLRCSGEV